MYVCVCHGITEHEIRACADAGACSVADLTNCLGVGAGCGRCVPCAKQILGEHRAEDRSRLAATMASG